MQLKFRIKKAPDYIFDFLTDMQKFVSVHPVIYKIENTGIDTFLVYETLKFGFVPFSFTYPVSIQKESSKKEVTISATVFKLTKIKMDFVIFSDEMGNSIVEETIQIKSILPIKFMMERIFKEQHQIFFRNIEMQ